VCVGILIILLLPLRLLLLKKEKKDKRPQRLLFHFIGFFCFVFIIRCVDYVSEERGKGFAA